MVLSCRILFRFAKLVLAFLTAFILIVDEILPEILKVHQLRSRVAPGSLMVLIKKIISRKRVEILKCGLGRDIIHKVLYIV